MSISLESRIKEQILTDKFKYVLDELTGINQRKFLGVLKLFKDKPSKRVSKVLEENIELATKCIRTLAESDLYEPSTKDLSEMYEILKVIESFILKHGDTNISITEKLATLHDLMENYLENVEAKEKGNLSEDLKNPNKAYQNYYHKYLRENVERISIGLNPKLKESDWNIDTSSDLGRIQSIALSDSKRSLTTGIDFSKSRGNLEYAGFGLKTYGQLWDEALLKALTKKRESKQEELSNVVPSWLLKRVEKRMKER